MEVDDGYPDFGGGGNLYKQVQLPSGALLSSWPSIADPAQPSTGRFTECFGLFLHVIGHHVYVEWQLAHELDSFQETTDPNLAYLEFFAPWPN